VPSLRRYALAVEPARVVDQDLPSAGTASFPVLRDNPEPFGARAALRCWTTIPSSVLRTGTAGGTAHPLAVSPTCLHDHLAYTVDELRPIEQQHVVEGTP
jgi:hypothetical protein